MHGARDARTDFDALYCFQATRKLTPKRNITFLSRRYCYGQGGTCLRLRGLGRAPGEGRHHEKRESGRKGCSAPEEPSRFDKMEIAHHTFLAFARLLFRKSSKCRRTGSRQCASGVVPSMRLSGHPVGAGSMWSSTLTSARRSAEA